MEQFWIIFGIGMGQVWKKIIYTTQTKDNNHQTSVKFLK